MPQQNEEGKLMSAFHMSLHLGSLSRVCVKIIHRRPKLFGNIQYKHCLTCGLAGLGAKTGRSPKDKRVVREPESEADIWWSDGTNGSPNFEMDDRWEALFDRLSVISSWLPYARQLSFAKQHTFSRTQKLNMARLS